MASVMQTARAEEFVELIRQRLQERTVRHSIAVAEMLVSLSEAARFSPEQATAAGLLHDLGKSMKKRDLLAAAERYGIAITQVQQDYPKLLHGPVAAEECRHDLGVDDEAVCEAIRWHTTGRPGLGPLGLALYFADYSEPLRDHPQAAEARALLAADGFVTAIRYVADQKLSYIRTKPSIDPMTEAFHAWLHTEYTA
jgi:predicted HD superfamily hydrolase involved in NAD metabolism